MTPVSSTPFSKRALAVCGVVVLGIIGSGLWDIAVKPLLFSVSQGIVFVASAVYQPIQDYIYAEVAKGRTDRTVLSQMALFLGILCGVMSSLSLKLFFPGRSNKDFEEFDVLAQTDQEKARLKLEEIENRLKSTGKRLKWFSLLTSIFTGTFLIIQFSYLSYIDRTITSFKQSFTICSPYMTPESILLTESAFAQIKTRKEYEDLVSALQVIAKNHNLIIPVTK